MAKGEPRWDSLAVENLCLVHYRLYCLWQSHNTSSIQVQSVLAYGKTKNSGFLCLEFRTCLSHDHRYITIQQGRKGRYQSMKLTMTVKYEAFSRPTFQFFKAGVLSSREICRVCPGCRLQWHRFKLQVCYKATEYGFKQGLLGSDELVR